MDCAGRSRPPCFGLRSAGAIGPSPASPRTGAATIKQGLRLDALEDAIYNGMASRMNKIEERLKEFQSSHAASGANPTLSLPPVPVDIADIGIEGSPDVIIQTQQKTEMTISASLAANGELHAMLNEMKQQLSDELMAKIQGTPQNRVESGDELMAKIQGTPQNCAESGVQGEAQSVSQQQLRDYSRDVKQEQHESHTLMDTKVSKLRKEVTELTAKLTAKLARAEEHGSGPGQIAEEMEKAEAGNEARIIAKIENAENARMEEIEGNDKCINEEEQRITLSKIMQDELETIEKMEPVVDNGLTGPLVTYAELSSHCSSKSSYTLQTSIWDAAIFIGCESAGTAGSIVVALGLLVNIMVQVVFTLIVYTQFINEAPYDDTNAYLRWRWKDGQSYEKMDSATDQALVSRVCGGDLTLSEGTAQVNSIQEIGAYTSGLISGQLASGKVLCTLCIFMFTVSILCEVDSATSFLAALWVRFKLRFTEKRTDGYWSHTQIRVMADNETVVFTKVPLHRIVCVALVLLVRMAVAWALLILGSTWLCYNTSIEDILLNASALQFVLDVDEVIYAAFCPSRVKILLDRTAPLESYRGPSVSGLGFRVMSHVVLAVGIVVYFTSQVLTPIEENMIKIQHAVCGGDKDFVVGEQSATGQLFVRRSSVFDSTDVDKYTFAMRAVKDILTRETSSVQEGALRNSTYATYEPDKSFQSLINVGMGSYVEQSRHRCRDRNLANDRPRLEAMRSRTKNREGQTCADFKDQCDDFRNTLVRLLCPETCLCGMPRTALYADGPGLGCAREACREEYNGVAAFAAFECTDPSPAELRADNTLGKAWKGWWNQYVEYWGTRSPFYGDMRENATKFGCGFTNIFYACEQTESLSSVRSFCPETCSCTTENLDGCPSTCHSKLVSSANASLQR